MAYMIDPAADFLWDSVSTTVNEKGVVEKQPRTDEEWNEVRRNAIIVAEASNLLMMEGRHVGESMVAAADARNVQALFDSGDTLDQVCEGCHLKFWHPPQKK